MNTAIKLAANVSLRVLAIAPLVLWQSSFSNGQCKRGTGGANIACGDFVAHICVCESWARGYPGCDDGDCFDTGCTVDGQIQVCT